MKMKNMLIGIVAIFLVFSTVPAFAAPAETPPTKTMTRYDATSKLARRLTSSDTSFLSDQDLEMLRKLIVEFWYELKAFGIRIEVFDKRLLELVSADIKPEAAPQNPFTELPLGHWAYDALKQLEVSLRSAPLPPHIILRLQHWKTTSSYAPLQETARYAAYDDNPVKLVARDPLSTFGLDVSTASYANVRRFLNAGRMPPPDAVRVEELINYFPAAAQDMEPHRLEGSPFAVACELAPCPWNDNSVLLWVSLTARSLDYREAPPANLVFLVDVSGSMSPPERLPLVKAALKMLTARLRAEDRISLVTYAGSTRVALEATKGSEKTAILAAIDGLGAGGSTAGAAGIGLAYEQARNAFVKGGINRILLCTDGDFNVGVSGTDELEAMVKKERESGVTLSVLGFGTDNYNDAMMTKIAGVGNGNYSYVDGMSEARKVLDEEMTVTLVTVAKDVKAQIEFNPANVIEYRQIGYEKRQLKNEDFNNDRIDAGDVGAGRRVTILYELTPVGAKPSVDPLRYQSSSVLASDDIASTDMKNDELAYLKFRWKAPDGDVSFGAETPVLKNAQAKTFAEAGTGLRFTAAVAAYGQKLRNNAGMEGVKWSAIESWADGARGDDPYRAEFLQLVKLAASVSGEPASSGGK
jgi:Ca-activated chloride channel family protein